MTQPWPEDWAETFDIVHQRMALPAAGRSAVLGTLRAFAGLLKPGGWMQLVEPDHSITKGPAMADFFRLLSDILKFMETGPDYAPQLKGWMADIGLVDIQEQTFDVPIGKGSPPGMEDKSARMMELAINGLIVVAKGMLHPR
jgi:gliotoxin biosynthesis N-methyltransferase